MSERITNEELSSLAWLFRSKAERHPKIAAALEELAERRGIRVDLPRIDVDAPMPPVKPPKPETPALSSDERAALREMIDLLMEIREPMRVPPGRLKTVADSLRRLQEHVGLRDDGTWSDPPPPQTVGRCGATLPVGMAGQESRDAVCHLPHGHAGQHRASWGKISNAHWYGPTPTPPQPEDGSVGRCGVLHPSGPAVGNYAACRLLHGHTGQHFAIWGNGARGYWSDPSQTEREDVPVEVEAALSDLREVSWNLKSSYINQPQLANRVSSDEVTIRAWLARRERKG